MYFVFSLHIKKTYIYLEVFTTLPHPTKPLKLKYRLAVYCSTCQSIGTGSVTILRISVGWRCSGVHIGLLMLVVLPY